MSLEDKINQDIKEAMRAKEEARLRTVRAIKAAILLMKTDGSGEAITAEREIQLLQKMIKQRQDSLLIYQQQNRPDLAQKEEEEMAVLQTYLPAQLSDEELSVRIRTIIAELGASSVKDMGKVMGMATKSLAGQADGRAISAKVKELLA
jgi:uncharacterized protein YqeY